MHIIVSVILCLYSLLKHNKNIKKRKKVSIKKKVVVDWGKAKRAAGCRYVALFRVRSLQNVVLQPMAF